MNRRYSVKGYQEAMEGALRMIPDVCFGTDVMVGFPGESQWEFGNTVAFIKDLPFSYLHVFSYSARPGTASTKIADPVSPKVINERSQILRELSRQKTRNLSPEVFGTNAFSVV